MEPSRDFNRHLGWQQGCRVLWRLGVIKCRKDSRAVMEAVGTVGRYRGRQAFMNIYDKNMLGNNTYNRCLCFFSTVSNKDNLSNRFP